MQEAGFIPLQNKCFSGYTGISLSVHSYVHVSACMSACVQNTSFFQSTGGGIELHLVTALVNHVLPMLQGSSILEHRINLTAIKLLEILCHKVPHTVLLLLY